MYRPVPSSATLLTLPSPRSLELSSLRMEAGLTHDELRVFLGRTDRTLRRWRVDGLPDWARTMLQLKAGYLDALGWSGWRVIHGELYAPDLAMGFRTQDLYELHWNRQLLKAIHPMWVQKPGRTA